MLCREFFRRLSEFGKVIVITGNHDMLENNLDRLDNLTAICDDLPIDYLVKSGSYRIENIIICVSSLVDKKFIKREDVYNPENLPVICLYHGNNKRLCYR